MEDVERKRPRSRRPFTPEFKSEVFMCCQHGAHIVGQVARDLTSSEREELAALR